MLSRLDIKKNILRIQSEIYQLIDWFIHPSIMESGPEAFRQARLGIVFSAVLISAAAIHVALFYLVGVKIASVIVYCALFLGICNLFFLRHSGRFFLSGIFLTTILLVTVCSINFFWGGWGSPGLVWLAVVPVIAINLSGRKAGYIWIIITLLCVFTFCLLDWYGFVFSSELNPGNLRLVQILMIVGVILVISLFILLYEGFKDYMLHIHKQAREEIRERAQMLDTILSASPFGIGLVQNRTLQWGNDALNRILGLEPNECIGMEARSFYPDAAEYERVGKKLYGERMDTGICEMDAIMVRKNREIFDCCLILNAVDPKDSSRGDIIAVMDITDRKKAEQEIKELNKQLEKRVFDRTEKLKSAQDEIVKKKYKSELADITTGTLHNVKNILNSVKISSEILYNICSEGAIQGLRKANNLLEENKDNMEEFILKDQKGKKLMQYYLKIGELFDREEAESLKHLKRLREKVNAIEHIVTAQQGYAGKSEAEDVSLEDLIEDALVMQAGSFEAHDIKVIKEYSDTPHVMAIKTKLMHVFINLIKNAKEAMVETPHEQRKLWFKTGQTDDSVFVQVKDTGCGIKEEDKKKMFQHGFTTKEKGHGFGLHSCFAYMKEMGGDMHVESQGQGKGATFILNFSAAHHPHQSLPKETIHI